MSATEGLIRSLIELGRLNIQSPNYSTLCLRQKDLAICLHKTKKEKPFHTVVDPTGLKVFGEGEWKVREHGYSKRRTCRKLHLAIDAETQEIEATVISTNDFKDSEILRDLLEQIDAKLSQVSGDSDYDNHSNYGLISSRNAKPVISPRETVMYRLKTIFSGVLKARKFENQSTEALLRYVALNKITQLGMPISYAVT